MEEPATRLGSNEAYALTGRRRVLCKAALLVGACLAVAAFPAPAGLSPAGQRALVAAVLAVGLWCTEMLPAGVTGILVVVTLVLSRAVPGFTEALAGFADPVPYFLIGVLTIGLAVMRSGLAERVALLFLRRCGGRSRALYVQLLLTFPLLTFLLPSATTRTGILIHVYEQVLELGHVPRDSHLAKAIMLALNSINRLASTVLLTGGITPMLSASLIGGMAWSRWLVLMGVPYLVLLGIGAALIYALHHRGFKDSVSCTIKELPSFSASETRTVIITLGASLLWLTDAVHHWNPALPALLAWACLLAPGIGVLTWKDFEHNLGWTNFFVIASSLSLARALSSSGASAWVADLFVRGMPSFTQSPLLVVAILLIADAPVRLLIPNISGFLATTIPIAMSIGQATELNPVVLSLAVMIAGDAVLYYPAQSASSVVIFERGYLTASEIFRFGLWMTLVAFLVIMVIALPYWAAVGFPLR